MIVLLNTFFSEEEKEILDSYSAKYNIEISILYSILGDELYGIASPHRVIFVGGLYLCEEKDELLSWYMGVKDGNAYSFWGNYGQLQNALEAL